MRACVQVCGQEGGAVHGNRKVLMRVMEDGSHELDGGEANDDGFGCTRSMATRARRKRWDMAAAHYGEIGRAHV